MNHEIDYLIRSLATMQDYCLDATTINEPKAFINSYNNIKEALKKYAEENNSRYIIEQLVKLPLFTGEEIQKIVDAERERQGPVAELSFITKDISAEDIPEALRSLFSSLKNMEYVIKNPDTEQLYYSIIDNPAATFLSLECRYENYWSRLIKSNIITLSCIMGLVLIRILSHPTAGSLFVSLVFTASAIFFAFASFKEAKFALLKLLATPENLYLKFSEGYNVKEMNLNWNNIIIIKNQYRSSVFREYLPVLTIQANHNIIFQEYANANNEITGDSVADLIVSLKNIQQAVRMVKEV